MGTSKDNIFQFVYWFMKTGNLREAAERNGISQRSSIELWKRKTTQQAVSFWIKHLKAHGMGFKLDSAEKRVKEMLDDLQERMKNASDSDYTKLAAIWMSMMGMFGGNWSEYNREQTMSLGVGNGIFQGEPKYLKSADVEFEEVTN